MSRKLLLVGWDSADWKVISPLIDHGEMPVMNKLVTSGIMGNLRTLEPMLSPLLWTSIATGKRAYDHGVHGFTEVDPLTGEVRPVTAASRRCKAIWNILSEHGLNSYVIGWFATHGERILNGGMTSNLFSTLPLKPDENSTIRRGTIWPEDDEAELSELRVHPEEIEADVISAFVPRWLEVDQLADNRLSHLKMILAECFSMQAAATWTLENKEWDFLAVYFRAIDEINHHFMPFHSPKMKGIPQREFEIYKDVVNSGYRLHDLMLARLIQLAGPDTTVMIVSDHGFHSDHLRPRFVPHIPAGITVWHRQQGVLAASGPDLLQDELVHGASLLDVTPTILTLFDLPVGEDMEGKVLLNAFREPPEIKTIPSWESTEAQAGGSSESMLLTQEESNSLLEQFEALGYIEQTGANRSERAASTIRENKWSLVRSYLDGSRFEDALPLLEELHEEQPERGDFAQLLARCQLRLGLHEEARETIDHALEQFGSKTIAGLLRAEIAYESGDYDESLSQLEVARQEGSQSVAFWRQLGLTYLKLNLSHDAEQACVKGLELDPDDAVTWFGLANSQLRQRRYREAIDSAHSALALKFDMPLAHFNLGWAYFRLSDYDRAEEALQTALKFFPDLGRAHYLLAALYRNWGDDEQARVHSFRRRESMENRQRETEEVDRRRKAAAERLRERRLVQQKEVVASSLSATNDALSNEPLDLVIVSGLPRSGTSLMMQMLQAGGFEVLSDGVRTADEHNPRGYYEWEAVRRLRERPALIEQAKDKAVKVISALVTALPAGHRYKVIYMRRPISEIAASQERMRNPSSIRSQVASPMLSILNKHEAETLAALQAASHIELLEVHYPELMCAPANIRAALTEFLGRALLPTREKMDSVVCPELHRQRLPDQTNYADTE